MRRFVSTFLCLCLTVCCFGATGAAAADSSKAFSDDPSSIQKASESVVMLVCYDRAGNIYATGSAFAAFEKNTFVTNYHVIEGETYSIIGQTETGTEFSISTIVAYDIASDIAIVRSEEDTGIDALALGSSTDLEKGDKVTTIGSPLGLINTVSTGLYSGVIVEDELSYLQFSAPISPGSSGGALFNDNGEVVGITSASFENGQNLNLAVPIEKVVDIWENHFDSTAYSLIKFYNLHEHVVSIDELYSDLDYFLSKDAPKKVTVDGYVYAVDKSDTNNYIITLVASNNDSPHFGNAVVYTGVKRLVFEFWDISIGDNVKLTGKIVQPIPDDFIYLKY